MNADPLIEEVARDRRQRNILVVAGVVGILASATLGIAFTFDLLGSWAHGASGNGNPAGLIFFVGPFALCMAIGYAMYRLSRRLAR
ncbi:MAG TPA: hypothetical protein VLX92_04380 [Kofleriaceae bacterium]|nr:hypothetical protein [Kofleriaceae bacterium]